MKMLVIVPILNRFDVAQNCLERLAENSTEPTTTILALDNGSETPLSREPWLPPGVRVVRNRENIGNYPVFGQAFELGWDGGDEIVAVLHSDLIVWERGWDKRVVEAFQSREKLGMVGFVGAEMLHNSGGRWHTMLNFQGRFGSPAEHHGIRIHGLHPAAVLDGCAMIFRTECLRDIGILADYPPHHFYDRLMPVQAILKGWDVGVLGIACDHISGQTASFDKNYHMLAKRWCETHGYGPDPNDPENWDLACYRAAEHIFLRDYAAHLPIRVTADWVVHGG